MIYAALLIAAYVLGALPFAVWISRIFYHDDIRRHGSGNAGSTNMYRTYGVKAGLTTQLLDIAKGAVAAALPLWALALEWMPARNEEDVVYWMLGCGIAAVLGHTFSIFIRFQGGKGVNSMLGMMAVIAPWGSLIALVNFLVLLVLFRMVSVGSMLSVLAFNVWVWAARPEDAPVLKIVGAALFIFVVYTHRTNIQRILNGTERKVNLFGKKQNG